MSDQNLFAEDWINCLRAHYAHVIHEHDTNNEHSLVSVLLQTGFTEQDIAEMHAEVTGEIAAAEPEMTALMEEEYQWVIQEEPKIANADEESYQWVVEAQAEEIPVEVEAIDEVQVNESAVSPEVEMVDEVQINEQLDSPEPEVEATIESETQPDSHEEEPPESFVQMSLF